MAGLLVAVVTTALLVQRPWVDDAASEGTSLPDPTGQASLAQPIAGAVVQLEDGDTHPRRLRLMAGEEFELSVQNSSTAERHFIVAPLARSSWFEEPGWP